MPEGVRRDRLERSGRHLGLADAQIAATALVHRVPLATRDIEDFEGRGITLINPWDHGTAA